MPRRKGPRARVRPDGTRRKTQGELLARAKRAAARAAAEEEPQYEEEAAAGDISGTESVNDEEDAGVAAVPLRGPCVDEDNFLLQTLPLSGHSGTR